MSNFFLRLNQIFTFLTLVCYVNVFISPNDFWLAGFLALLIPFLQFSHLFFIIFWIFLKNYWKSAYSVAILLIGAVFFNATFALSFSSNEKTDFSVLSYNVRVFNLYDHLNQHFKSSQKMIDWAKNSSSEIKCFQEFYQQKDSKIFNTIQQIKEKGTPNVFFQKTVANYIGGEFGLAIFSKFPIINKGEIVFTNKSFNNAIFADLLVGKDTIRVYNVHLQSMSIDEKSVAHTDSLQKNIWNLSRRLKKGFIARALQIDKITEHIKNCPYRIIFCSDLNDLPYSYTYFSLKKLLKNAFEESANGFEFSYNGKLFFLRIDNQFFSEGLQALHYETQKEMHESDHFPIKVDFSLEMP